MKNQVEKEKKATEGCRPPGTGTLTQTHTGALEDTLQSCPNQWQKLWSIYASCTQRNGNSQPLQLWQPEDCHPTEMRVLTLERESPLGSNWQRDPRAPGWNSVHPSHRSDPSVPVTSRGLVHPTNPSGHGQSPFLEEKTFKRRVNGASYCWLVLRLQLMLCLPPLLLYSLIFPSCQAAVCPLGCPRPSSLRSLNPWLPSPCHTMVARIAQSQLEIQNTKRCPSGFQTYSPLPPVGSNEYAD